MLKSVFMFSIGVFCVWYVPAGKAAVFGEAGFIVALLAGLVVAIPVSLFAGIGALISAFLIRPTSPVATWLSALSGLVAGLIIQFITATPTASSGLLYTITQLLSGVPTLLLITLVGSFNGIVMFKFARKSHM